MSARYPASGGPSKADPPRMKVNTPEGLEISNIYLFTLQIFSPKASLSFSAARSCTMTPEVTVGRGLRLNPERQDTPVVILYPHTLIFY